MCSIGKSTFLSHYAYEVSCRTREVRVPYLKRFAPSSIATKVVPRSKIWTQQKVL